MSFFSLQAEAPHSKARAGVLYTAHGEVLTPIFMPVGTQATVKAISQEQLSDVVKAQIILANTYHVYLRPGTDCLTQAGGLHQFMQWHKPILTDSGGYQVFSLAGMRKIKPDGVTFRSHIDGSLHHFTPTNVVDKQRAIGSDIMMAFDECPPYPSDYNYAKKSLDITHQWAKISRERFLNTEPLYGYSQYQFGIIQGSTYHDLRKQSAEFIESLNFDGNAIGGLAVGEPVEQMYELTDFVTDLLPKTKPRYLMGVGTPINLLESVDKGIDMMDCVMPTRNARHGLIFTLAGQVNLKNAKFKHDFSPLDPTSPETFDQMYTKAYVRHLLIAGEMLGFILTSLHNLCFYLRLMGLARTHILDGDFSTWKTKTVQQLSQRL